MPKPQKYRDVVKVAKANGWVLIRQVKGDHEIWSLPDACASEDKHSIPHHKEISAGVIADLLKKLPHTPESWR